MNSELNTSENIASCVWQIAANGKFIDCDELQIASARLQRMRNGIGGMIDL